ncbi:MAG: PLP-dependent aminotransferase family protein [Actinomycetota bacterium]
MRVVATMRELQLDLPSGRGRRAAIETALRDAIRTGRLGGGTRLPSTRTLASDLGVSRSTVVAVYEQLGAEGFVIGRHGSGTEVATVAPVVGAEDDDLLEPSPTWDFRSGEPDASAFPRRDWLRAIRQVVSDPSDRALTYPDPRGHPEVRAALADHLARTRSVGTTAAGIFVTGGFAAGLGFVADALRRTGIDHIAVEEAMLPMHRMVLRLAGLEVTVVPVDEEGIAVHALADSSARAVLVTPANHYPYGITMTAGRRADLVAWADAADGWIIEDDYDGEFRYDRRPIGALQALAPNRVVYGGTASKTLGPGLRLGWLAVPKPLRQPLLAAVNLRAGVSVIDQLALADLIQSGRLDRHVREMRRRYGRRRRAVVEALGDTVPWFAPPAGLAGLHLCVPTPSLVLEEAILARAEAADVGLLGLCNFHRAPPHRAGVTIGFSRPPAHAFDAGLERVMAVFEAATADMAS